MIRIVLLTCVSLLLGVQLGCTTPGTGQGVADATPNMDERVNTTYRAGDKIKIDFSDNVGMPRDWQQTVREDGTITLPLSQTIRAADLRKGELERAIHDLYVPRILKRLTVNVQAEERSYFVSGEVKIPGQKGHTGLITSLQAVAAAGDFTDYANKSKIDVVRANGEQIRVNGKKVMDGEAVDVPVYPGDRVHVHRRIF